MIPPKNTKKRGHRNLTWLIILGIVFLVMLLFVGIGVGLFFFMKQVSPLSTNDDISKPIANTSEQKSKIKIAGPKENDYVDPKYFKSTNKLLNDANWLDESNFKRVGDRLIYTDPINHIKFIDNAYGTDEDTRFFLDKTGLALLAHEFYEKVTFGPEIISLKSININDFSVIDNSSAGLYLPQVNTIYLNGFYLAEKHYPTRNKVIFLMEALFHEYQHHWATSYASYGSKNQNDPNTIYYKYRVKFNEKASLEPWNKNFVEGYKNSLHYDFNYLRQNYEPFKDSITRELSLNDIFEYANSTEASKSFSIYNKLTKIKGVTFRPNNKWIQYTNIDYSMNVDSMPYFYSMAELVPREWQKFTYVPYYIQGVTKKNYETEQVQKFIKENNYYNFALPLEITHDVNYESKRQKWTISQNYYGNIIKNGYDQLTLFSAYANDWGRTAQNGSLFKIGDDDKTIFELNKEASSYAYPNSVWGLNYNYRDKNYRAVSREFEDTHHEFYQKFLETMFYGKPFAQIKSEIAFFNVNFVYAKELNNYQFTGYLPSNDFKYLVYYTHDNKVKMTPLSYVNYYNYNVKNSYASGIRDLSPEMLNDILNTKYKNKYYAYYTKFINSNEINPNKPLYFFKGDLNNNGKHDDNEVWKDFNENDLPDYRYLISSDYLYYKLSDFRTKRLILDNGNIKLVKFDQEVQNE